MRDHIFEEPVIDGVQGRNGYATLAGLSFMEIGGLVHVSMIGTRNRNLTAGLKFAGSDCGRIARLIAESGAEASPESREAIASELRAALVRLECAPDDRPEDGVSNFDVLPR